MTTTARWKPEQDCSVQCYLVFAVSVFLGILSVIFVCVIVYVVKKIEKRLKVTPVAAPGAVLAPNVAAGAAAEEGHTGTPPNFATAPATAAPFKTLNNSNGHMTIAYGNFNNNLNNNNNNATNNNNIHRGLNDPFYGTP